MKHFVRYPVSAFLTNISPIERSIFLQLLFQHFHICGKDYSKEFYITDRFLAELCHCSTESIWRAKNSLSSAGLLSFRVGPGNKTFYSIISGNGHDPL